MKRRVLWVVCALPAAAAIFLFLTLLFTPNDAIKGVMVRVAENAGYTLECSGFGKRLPLAVKADSITVSSEKGALVKLRNARVRLDLLPLLAGKVRFSYRGMIGAAGEIEGDATLTRTRGWTLQCRGVRLEDVPFFATVAEARVKGELRGSGTFALSNELGNGEIQLQVRGAELAGVKVGMMPLPDAWYRDVRGALKIEKGRAELKSFTLDGDGIYVRLKGDSILARPPANSPLNLTLEMMPKQSFLEKQKLVFLLLMKYQTSPGAFSVPIRGTLAHPSI